jgi:Fe-S-cluster containining protein
VAVTGYDAWLIATAQHLAFEQFLVHIAETNRTAGGFSIDHSGATYAIALSRRDDRREERPCVFLMQLPGGHGRCGIYPHRPEACRVFPAVMRKGSVTIREDVVCPQGSWNIAAMDLPNWRLRLLRAHLEWAVYHLVVRHWNEALASSPPDTVCSPLQYYAYLMNVYHRMDPIRSEVGATQMDAIVTGWASSQRMPDALAEEKTTATVMTAWRDYLERLEAVVAASGVPISATFLEGI